MNKSSVIIAILLIYLVMCMRKTRIEAMTEPIKVKLSWNIVDYDPNDLDYYISLQKIDLNMVTRDYVDNGKKIEVKISGNDVSYETPLDDILPGEIIIAKVIAYKKDEKVDKEKIKEDINASNSGAGSKQMQIVQNHVQFMEIKLDNIKMTVQAPDSGSKEAFMLYSSRADATAAGNGMGCKYGNKFVKNGQACPDGPSGPEYCNFDREEYCVDGKWED